MKKILLSITFLMCLIQISSAQSIQQLGADLDGLAAGDDFGFKVSMSDGNTVAVSSPFGGPASQGYVRVFDWDGSNWIQRGANIIGEASFDRAAYIDMPDDNTIAIGAVFNDGNGTDSGHVRIYTWDGSSWVQKGADIDGEAGGGLGDRSGNGVSMPDANTVAIGAYLNNGTGTSAGHVRIFEWDGTAWIQKGLDIDAEAADDRLSVVSMPTANTVSVGAVLNDGNGSNAGHVRIYDWDGSAWIQRGNDLDGLAAGDYFGSALSMPDMNTIAVGAPQNGAGYVQVFTWDGAVWSQQGTTILGEATNDSFGMSVTMPSPDYIAVGAAGNQGNGAGAGHVRILSWDGTDWVQFGLDIDGEAAGDNSGGDVCMPNNETLVVGASNNDDNGTDAGHARIYTLCATTTSTDVQSACDSYTWIDGNTYTADNNTATFTLTNAAGCDSIVTLDLTIISIDDQTVTASPTELCDNGSSTISIGNSQTGVDYYLRNDSNNSIVDGPISGTGSSLNFNSGTINTTTTYNVQAQKMGTSSAILFEETAGSYSTVSGYPWNTATTSNGLSFTIEHWVKFNDDIGTNQTYINTIGNTMSPSFNFIEIRDDGVVYWRDAAGEIARAQAGSFPVDGQYHHVAIVYDDAQPSGSKNAIYIDGVNTTLTSNNDISGPSPASGTMQIGRAGTNSFYTLDGELDELRFWSDARTLTEINDNMSNQLTGSETDLVAYYNYEEGSGTTSNDVTGNGFTSTLINTTNANWVNRSAVECTIEMSQTVTVTVNNSNTGTDIQTACDSYTWIDGNTYTADNNTATHTLTNVAGCDSVVTLNLTINNSNTGTDVQTACDSYTWIDGNTYTSDNNTATHTLTNVAGCDSVVTLDLTINNSNTGTDVQTACDSYTWIDGNTYTSDNNTATHTLTNVAGCDSVVTLNLTINNSNTGTDVQTACDSYTWIDGNTYTSDNNTATHTLTNVAGCDSVVTLDLTINNSNTGTDVQTACDSYTWIDGNTYTSDNNTATHTLTNVAGCDSVVTLNLTINNSNTGTDVQTACDSYTWIDGNTYTSDNNTATHTLTNVAGCDSVVTLNLTINNSNTGTDVQTACDSYTWIDGNTYTSDNNTATHTLTNVAGCDSVVTLNLTINNSNTGTDVQTACDSYTWIDGNTYTSDNNNATHVLTNAAGCDSTVTLDLTILNSTTGTDVQTACDEYTWIDGNTYTADNNTATFTLTNAAGCDSVVTLDLTINTVDVSVTNTSPTLSATVSGASYQWLDCDDNYAVIPGETNQDFTATVNGNYAVAITQNNCTDTSACETVDNVGIQKNNLNLFKVYPNPAKDQLTIELSSSKANAYRILDATGRLIKEGKLKGLKTTLDVSNFKTQIYFIKVDEQVIKFVKH